MLRFFSLVWMTLFTISSAAAQQGDPPIAESDGHEERAEELLFAGGGDVFARYRASRFEGSDQEVFHTFELERAHLWAGATYGFAEANLLLEAVPGSDEGGALAIGGDSLLLRLREAYAAARWSGFRFSAGIVRTMTQPLLESVEGLRALGMGAQESTFLLAPADVGASLTWRPECNRIAAGLAVYSGESYRSRELNSGKNVEAFVRVRPLSAFGLEQALVAASFTYGTEGVASTRAHRAFGLLAWDSDVFAAGIAYTHAFGYRNEGDREAWLLQGFARAQFLERWLLFARAHYFDRNRDVANNRVHSFEFGAGAKLHPALTALVHANYRGATSAARADEPQFAGWDVMLTLRARFEHNSVGLDELR